jgi:hypothetical protein
VQTADSLTAFLVRYIRYGAGVEDTNISLLAALGSLVSRLSQRLRQTARFGEVEFAA